MNIFPYTWRSLCWRQDESLCQWIKFILLLRKLDLSVIYKVFKQNEKSTCIKQCCICWVWLTPKTGFKCKYQFVSGQLMQFCRCLNIDQVITSLHHHQSNRQVEICIKFMNCTIKKCIQTTNHNVHFGLLTPISTGLTSQAMLLFNRPVRALLPQTGWANKH